MELHWVNRFWTAAFMSHNVWPGTWDKRSLEIYVYPSGTDYTFSFATFCVSFRGCGQQFASSGNPRWSPKNQLYLVHQFLSLLAGVCRQNLEDLSSLFTIELNLLLRPQTAVKTLAWPSNQRLPWFINGFPTWPPPLFLFLSSGHGVGV